MGCNRAAVLVHVPVLAAKRHDRHGLYDIRGKEKRLVPRRLLANQSLPQTKRGGLRSKNAFTPSAKSGPLNDPSRMLSICSELFISPRQTAAITSLVARVLY